MFKFTNVFGQARQSTASSQHQSDLVQLTNVQALAVYAGNGNLTGKGNPTDKPPVATTSSTEAPPTIPASPIQRPPFN